MCVTNSTARRGPIALPILNNQVAALVEQVDATIQRKSRSKMPSKRGHRVVHSYHDHLFDQQDGPEPVARGGVMTPFPLKLHDVLKNIEEDGLADIISWQPHGRCFVVHKPDVFLKDVMPKYFSQTRIASFQRQLNLYGFNRITKGPDKNGYYHELFLRGKEWLAHDITRRKVKGTRVRGKADPEHEPDFYQMPPVDEENLKKRVSVQPRPDKVESSSTSLITKTKTSNSTESKKRKVCAPKVISPHLSPTATPTKVLSETSLCPLEAAPRLPNIHQALLPPQPQDDDDDIMFFEGCKFHYLNPYAEQQISAATAVPFHPEEVHSHSPSSSCFGDVDMDELFTNLNIPKPESPVSLEDDVQFANILEALLL